MVEKDEFKGSGRFQIIGRLGSGGMGVVYEALDHETGAHVALKTLRRFSAQSLYQLKNEFRGLQDLQHQNLCGLGELLEEEGQWFFTMELVQGVDFLTYVRKGAPATATGASATLALGSEVHQDPPDTSLGAPRHQQASQERLTCALLQLAQGLNELHRNGKVHRDIKPSNIMVTGQGRVVLLDFGLATDSIEEFDAAGDLNSLGNAESIVENVVGTVSYMAPEQAAQGDVGPPADWYAVGVMIYEALTGTLPFRGKSLQVLLDKQNQEPPPVASLADNVSPELDALCSALLQKDAQARPSASQVLRRLGDSRVPEEQGMLAQEPPRVFVGRETELKALAEAFDSSGTNQPRAVVVYGESGLGKTALLLEATSRILARSPDTIVLRGRCYERESVPFKAFDGVVDALSRWLRQLRRSDADKLATEHTHLLVQVFPVLGRVEAFSRLPTPRGPRHAPHQLRSLAFSALRQLLRTISQRVRLVLVIDDWQWADKDSAVLMKDLLRAADAPALLLLVSARTESNTDEQGHAFPLSTRGISLQGLSKEAAARLSANLMDAAGLSTADASALAGEAQGHPLYIDALIRHAARVGTEGTLRLDEALAQRVSEFTPSARRVAELACVAGEPIPQVVLRKAAEVTVAEYMPILASLRLANTLRGQGVRESSLVEPYHDRVREAVVTTLDVATRQRHNQSLARAIEDEDLGASRPDLLIRYLQGAGEHQQAATRAIEAGERANLGLAFDQCAEFYQLALQYGDFGRSKERELRLATAQALAQAGRGPEAAKTFVHAAQGAGSVTRRNCQRQAAEQWLTSGHIQLGLEAMRALLQEIGVSMPASPQRALVSLLGYRLRLRLGGYRCEIQPDAALDPVLLDRIDVLLAVSSGLNMVDMIIGANFQSQGLLLALRVGCRQRVGRALVVEAAQVVSTGSKADYNRAQRLLAQVRGLANDDAQLNAWARVGDGAADYLCSHLVSAEQHLELAEAELRALHNVNWELGQLRVFRLSNLRRLGALSKMSGLIEDYVRDAQFRGDLYAETSITLCCSRVWLREDQVDAAKARIAGVKWTPPEHGYHLQHWYAFAAKVEFELYEGIQTDVLSKWESEFVDLNRAMLLRIMIVRTEASWIRGRLALVSALAADGKEAKRLRRVAAQMAKSLANEDDGFASVVCLLLLATLAMQAGNTVRARGQLRSAIVRSSEVGTRLHGASARRRLGQMLGGKEGRMLITTADKVMRQEGIEDPASMVRVYLPGWPTNYQDERTAA